MSKRTPGVTLRLTDEQRAAVQKYAKRHGLPSMAAALWHGFAQGAHLEEEPTIKDRVKAKGAR